MNKLFKTFDIKLKSIPELILLSTALAVPALVVGDYLIYALPLFVLILLWHLFGDRFLMVIIVISLFTIIGEVSRILRSIVYLVDFTILGYFFLRKYGLNFNNYPSIPRSILYFLLLYFSAMILSSVMSKYPFAGTGIILQQIAFFVIVYVFYSLISDTKDIKNYFTGIYLVAGIIVAFSIFVFFKDGLNLLEIISPDRPRVSVITGNIESSTNFFVVSFPLIIGSFLLKKKFPDKVLHVLILCYFTVGLVLMMSRSAIIGIIFSSGIIFYLLNRKRFYKFITSVAGVVLLFIFYPPLNELMTIFLRIESGMSARDYLWQMSIDMIKDNPIFGLGPGVYKYEMINYFPYMLNEWWGRLVIYLSEVSGGANLSHNFFLTLFTEMGILGIITAISLPVIFIKIGIKTINKFKEATDYNYFLIISLFAAGVSIIVRNFFNGIGLLYMGGLQTDLPFWLIFSSIVYFYQYPITSIAGNK